MPTQPTAPLAHNPGPFFVERDPETDLPRKCSTGYAVHKNSDVVRDGIETVAEAQAIALAMSLAAQNAALVAALEIAERTLTQAQKAMESGCEKGRYTWLDAPIDIAREALAQSRTP